MKFNLKKPAFYMILVSVCSFICIEVTRSAVEGPLKEFRLYNNSSFIEPLEIVSLSLLVVGVWLWFFKHQIQRQWWRIAQWFVWFAAFVLAVSLAIPYQGSGFIAFPGVYELMIIWSLTLGFFTVVYTLAKRHQQSQ